MPTRPDLNLLLTLETLLSEHNVTRAAAKLNSSQPAVSAQLVRLRKMFNDPLLIPGPRGMTPTPRAQELAPRLSELLDGFRAILQPEEFDLATAEATILIATNDAIQCRMAKWLGEMAEVAPNLHIGFIPASRLSLPDVDALMATGRIDIAIALPSMFPDRLHVRSLHNEDFVCVMRRDHAYTREHLTVAAFASMKHVVVSPLGGDFLTTVDEALRRHGLARRTVVSVPNFLAAEQILRETDFLSVFPATMAHNRMSFLKAYELPVHVPDIEIVMAWHQRTHLSPVHRWVRQQVADLLATTAISRASEPMAQVVW